jgi:hypothetical protein
MKKIYESTKKFRDKYNKKNATVQLDRELLNDLKAFLNDKDTSIKSFLEILIKKSIK